MNHHQDVHPILPTAESQRSTRPSALSKSTSSMVDASKALDDPIKKRPFMTKFATIHTDRYPQNLRRDFPLNQFEGNLTVEKAHFEPQPLTNPTKEPMVAPVQALPSQPYPFSASQQPTQPSQFHDSDLSHTLSTTGHRGAGSPPSHEYHPSSSPPRHAYTAPPSIVGITPPPPPPPSHTPSSGAVPKTRNSVKPKNEEKSDKNTNRINKKRRRAAPSYGVATPSEVFHRNLVDAVSNVEDSDDNECYVYPYSSSTNTEAPSFYYDQIHRTPSSSLYRPQSLRSHPLTPSHEGSSRPHITGFLTDFFRPALMMSSTSKGHDDEHDENECNENYRPKLRTYVMDHPQRSKNSDPSHASFRHGSKEMERCYDGKPRRNPYMGYTDGYTSDDEGAPLLRASRTGSRYRSTWNLSLSALAICMLLFVIVAYRAKPLMDVSVEVGRVLASDKELIFDLRVKASNWNWWTLRVADADISVFAFSQVVPLEDTFNTTRSSTRGVDPAEYLGGCVHFDEPLSFASSVFHSRIVSATTQIRIKSPGADKSGNERWSRIIRYPYGLLARGVLRYRSLPVVGLYPQTVAICDVANVEPNTGRVSEDPDQAYCLNYR